MTTYQINFSHPVSVHFIGIGGISMSGLASILLDAGFTVSGSDASASTLTAGLEKQGAHIQVPQRRENIPAHCDLIVYTAAIHPDNPEYQEAQERHIPMLTRAQLLGQIMANYSHSVAIAGTHGKTTTTSMLSHMAMAGELDPTISVGGMLPLIDGNIRVGKSPVFIAEACEYTNSFLSLQPYIGMILNIDADHLDFFKDLEDIRRSFHRFAQLVRTEGTLIIDGSIPHREEITADLSCRVITTGHPGCDYEPKDIVFDELGFASFALFRRGDLLGHFHLRVPGMHNVTNASAAIAAADLLGISAAQIQSGLDTFTGTGRRFEQKGTYRGVHIIDDYAHHPTEIQATLDAASHFPHRKLWCVFQPHTYSRTKSLMTEFARVLSECDEVVLCDIYPARETDNLGISSQTLCDHIRALGGNAVCTGSFTQTEDYLLAHITSGDLLITMGAGDVYRVGEHLLAGA